MRVLKMTNSIILELDWGDQFPIGRHKYVTVASVFESDPNYLIWFRDNVDDYAFTDEVNETIIDWEDGILGLKF